MAKDITEDIPYDISSAVPVDSAFVPTNIAYDISINNLPFVLRVNNQTPFRRETAPYKKDQFDNSTEPGEQSLTGWWIRSQTSWHHGAGTRYYEPGTNPDSQYRFWDSRGVNPWVLGEVSLLNDTFHSYTGSNGIVAAAGGGNYIVSGDSAGALKKLALNGDSAATATSYTLVSGHSSSNPFKAVTTDGTRYYAVCDVAIHAGKIDGTGSDVAIYRHNTGGVHCIKFTKGYLMFGEAGILSYLPVDSTVLLGTGHSTSGSTIPAGKTHDNTSFVWNVIEGGATHIYAAGYAGSESEIWAVPFDSATLLPDPESAVQVAQLPYGEIVSSLAYYLGYLVIGTNKGIRVASVAPTTGTIIYGPLLFESDYEVTGLVAYDKFVWASTTVLNGTITNAVLVRVDLSSPFEDGTFAYAYDLQYESDEDSTGDDVIYANDRLHIVTSEGTSAGEIQTEKLSAKRTSGWIETGYIRHGTVEPKFFKYLKITGTSSSEDSINIETIDSNGNEYDLSSIGYGSIGSEIGLSRPSTSQEMLAFKLTINNASPFSNTPTITSYQVKSVPAVKRQRLYQYPLSCFNTEMDRFNLQFGYSNRAYELLTSLEQLEEIGDFVTVRDFRTGEQYQGIIEEIQFTNESSTDKDDSGYGGVILITIRKM
jgi:hypothetical protein